jgi:hypothetical protein
MTLIWAVEVRFSSGEGQSEAWDAMSSKVVLLSHQTDHIFL